MNCFRPEISQKLGGYWAGNVSGDFNSSDAFKWLSAHPNSPFLPLSVAENCGSCYLLGDDPFFYQFGNLVIRKAEDILVNVIIIPA